MITLEPFLISWVIVLGLVVGSFLNVVIARLPHEKSLIRPRSHCPTCGYVLQWFDNIPVLSYLLLLGKCRKCHTKISLRYPVVELLTAIVFVAAFHRYGGIAFEGSWVFWVRDLPVWAALLASVFIDLDHRIIPDEISFGVLGYSLLLSYFVPSLGISQSVLGAVLGFGIFYGIAWFYFRRTGRSGMGGGDIKLLAAIGAFLGPIGVLTTIMVSSILGSVIGILWGLYEGRKKSSEDGTLMKTSIPFGPFLVLGAWVYYLLGDRLWHPFQNL